MSMAMSTFSTCARYGSLFSLQLVTERDRGQPAYWRDSVKLVAKTDKGPAAEQAPAPAQGPTYSVQQKMVLAFSTYEIVFNTLEGKLASKRRTVG